MQDQDVLDPELAAAWFQLLADFPANLPGKSQQCTTAVEAVISDNFGMAVECLCRQEEDFLRSLVAFLRSALVRNESPDSVQLHLCYAAFGISLTSISIDLFLRHPELAI